MKTPLIAASVLSADFCFLEKEVHAVANAGADILHLDIMDGHYVPNLTFGYAVIESIIKVSKLPLDAHLMVTNPMDYVPNMAKLGVTYLSFHPETIYHPHRLVYYIKENGMKAGLALNPGTSLSTIEYLLNDADFILLMSVNPGYSGQSFIDSVVPKIKELKAIITKHNLQTLIEVDGGINAETAGMVISAGADILVSASYIFHSNNYTQAIYNLKHSLQ